MKEKLGMGGSAWLRNGGLHLRSCILWLICALAEVTARADFTFVQLCDPQLGMTDYKEDICSLEQAVKQIDSIAPDFLLVCGDLVHKPNETSFSDFRKIMESAAVPCKWLPGNHDLTLAAAGDTLPRYQELFGRDYYSFDHKGFRFVVLDTLLFKNALPAADAEMAWLKDELQSAAKAGAIPVLAGHHPPFCEKPAESDGWSNLPSARRHDLLALLEQYRVPIYLSGHTHRFIQNRSGATEFVSGESSSVNMDGRPLGFRLWHVRATSQWHSTFIPLYKRPQIKPKPPYDPAPETGTAAACLGNLRLIDAAKEAFAMQRQLTNGAAISAEDLAAVIPGGLAPIACPDQGQYRIKALGADPECSHPGHQLPYFYQFEEFQKRAKDQASLRMKLKPAAAPDSAPGGTAKP